MRKGKDSAPPLCILNVVSLNFLRWQIKDVKYFPSQSCALDLIYPEALHAAKTSFLQKLFL